MMDNPQRSRSARMFRDDPQKSFIAGIFGGCAGVLGSHPFDIVKCRIQSQSAGNIAVRYSNAVNAFTSIIKEEGVRAIYKGVRPPLLGQAVINGIVFGVEDYAAKHTSDTGTFKHLKTGMAAGFIQSFICAPMELVKLHTQHQKIGEVGRYQGNLEAFKKILHKEGMRGCYRGLTVTMVRDVSGFGVYFATYEGLMNVLAEKQGISREGVGVTAQFIFGGTAGVASWACNYPVDLAKTGFQMDGVNGTERQYRSSWDVIIKAWKKGGIRSLYPGFVSTLARAFAFSMCTFPAVEFVKRQLGSQQGDKM